MTLKRRLSKVERAVSPREPSFTLAFCDDAGVMRDVEGNVITGQLSGKVIVFDECIRGA
jgi:hypothetical protein